MEITTVTTIKLEDAEISALKTLKDAYIQCEMDDSFNCSECPLYIDNTHCIGALAEKVLNAQEKRTK